MSELLTHKLYVGMDNVPAAFDIKSRISGPNGRNFYYIRQETGVQVVLKGDSTEGLYLVLQHLCIEALAEAILLALTLLETVCDDLVEWTVEQAVSGDL